MSLQRFVAVGTTGVFTHLKLRANEEPVAVRTNNQRAKMRARIDPNLTSQGQADRLLNATVSATCNRRA